MKIGYRRASGKLPLTTNENGARGTWLEKRHALWIALAKRGHTIVPLSKPTQNSIEAGWQEVDEPVDYLIVEFAGNNLSFYGKDWLRTVEIVKRHKGRVLFLNDDPDLPYLWKLSDDEDWSRWTIAVNAVNLDAARDALKVPKQAAVVDFPFASLLIKRSFVDGAIPDAIYYGRPNGRAKVIQPYLDSGRLLIAGKPQEWEKITKNVIPAPEQKDRADWYGQFRTCLAIYDNKHAATGWRTGRAYHALAAGIPVCAPIGNRGLLWAEPTLIPMNLTAFLRKDVEERAAIHAQQLIDAHPQIDWLALGL